MRELRFVAQGLMAGFVVVNALPAEAGTKTALLMPLMRHC